MRTIRLGSRGDDVRAWQIFLHIGDTGTFDDATKKATEEWQGDNDLVADGIVGVKSYGKARSLGFADEEQPQAVVDVDPHGTVPGEFHLSSGSLSRLAGVQESLVKVVTRAIEITSIDFTVLEGLRTIERQRLLLARGSTTTLRSRHLTGHAVDIAPLEGGRVSWDWPLYHRLAIFIKAAAEEVDVPLEWGGDWKTFKDGPHWQLPW